MTTVWPSCSSPIRGTVIGCRACSSWRPPGGRDTDPEGRLPHTSPTVSTDRKLRERAGGEPPSSAVDRCEAEQLSGLAVEHLADGGERAVADRLGPVVLHDAEVHQ